MAAPSRHGTAAAPAQIAAGFDAIGLDELDERAALQRRTDRKYLVPVERFAALSRELRGDHDALEIDGARVAAYDSVYFDTPGLRCFADHVEGRTPRFKIRSRLYVDTRVCSFEVKVKTADETIKEHLDHPPDEHGVLTGEASEFADATLDRCMDEHLPEDLAPALRTSFRRMTLAARDGSERVTVDSDLELARPDGARARLAGDVVLVEVKSADGDGPFDRLLRGAGIEEVSLSKYRTGMALLTGRRDEATAAAERFLVEPPPDEAATRSAGRRGTRR